MIAGVCAGLAEYFETDPTLVRLLFLLLTFVGGSGILLYGICWLLLPSETEKERTVSQESLHRNAEQFAQEIKDSWKKIDHGYGRGRSQAGLWLVGIGIFFLLVNFGLFSFSLLGRLWPIILIIIGWQILTRSRR